MGKTKATSAAANRHAAQKIADEDHRETIAELRRDLAAARGVKDAALSAALAELGAAREQVSRLVSERNECFERLSALGEENAAAANLLAVMHGDGGHYLDEHGWSKAVRDAQARWYLVLDNLAAADQEKARAERYREALERMNLECGYGLHGDEECCAPWSPYPRRRVVRPVPGPGRTGGEGPPQDRPYEARHGLARLLQESLLRHPRYPGRRGLEGVGRRRTGRVHAKPRRHVPLQHIPGHASRD